MKGHWNWVAAIASLLLASFCLAWVITAAWVGSFCHEDLVCKAPHLMWEQIASYLTILMFVAFIFFVYRAVRKRK